MSYYATGHGDITFKKLLNENEKKLIRKELESVIVDTVEFDDVIGNESYTTIPIFTNSKYDDDVTAYALDKIAEIAEIQDGIIEFTGEDWATWRFVFKDDKWIDQIGITDYECGETRIAEAFRSYVMHDLESGNKDHVFDVLHNVCGLNDKDLEDIGINI